MDTIAWSCRPLASVATANSSRRFRLLVGDVLRVNGNECLATPGGDYFGAKLAQDARQDIAAYRRMLIHKNAQARETAAGEAAQIATNVRFFGGASDRRQVWRPLEHSRGIECRFGRGPAVLLNANAFDLPRDALFVLLQCLSDALVELDAVTIEWNMAAAHHHASASGGDGVMDQCGRGDLARVLHLAARVDNRSSAGAHDAIGARPEVTGDNHCAARMNIANAQKNTGAQLSH